MEKTETFDFDQSLYAKHLLTTELINENIANIDVLLKVEDSVKEWMKLMEKVRVIIFIKRLYI